MAPSLVASVAADSDRSRESKRKKRKKSQSQSLLKGHRNQYLNRKIRWKSEDEQRSYSSKLIQALRHVRLSSPTSSSEVPKRGRAVRLAADQALATVAKGRTRWSRAILANRIKLKFMKQRRQKASLKNHSRSTKPRVGVFRLKAKNVSIVQRKARVLGGLVPGCRKQPLPVILEEATDYIAALEMQVRTMTALTQLLSGAGHSTAPFNSNQASPS